MHELYDLKYWSCFHIGYEAPKFHLFRRILLRLPQKSLLNHFWFIQGPNGRLHLTLDLPTSFAYFEHSQTRFLMESVYY